MFTALANKHIQCVETLCCENRSCWYFLALSAWQGAEEPAHPSTSTQHLPCQRVSSECLVWRVCMNTLLVQSKCGKHTNLMAVCQCAAVQAVEFMGPWKRKLYILRQSCTDLHRVHSTYLWWSADFPSSSSETGLPSECRLSFLLHLRPYIHPPRDSRPPCCPPLRLSGFLRQSRTPATTPSCRCCHSCPRAGARPPLNSAGSASNCGPKEKWVVKKVQMKRRWREWAGGYSNVRESAETVEAGGGGGLLADICCTTQLAAPSSHAQSWRAATALLSSLHLSALVQLSHSGCLLSLSLLLLLFLWLSLPICTLLQFLTLTHPVQLPLPLSLAWHQRGTHKGVSPARLCRLPASNSAQLTNGAGSMHVENSHPSLLP